MANDKCQMTNGKSSRRSGSLLCNALRRTLLRCLLTFALFAMFGALPLTGQAQSAATNKNQPKNPSANQPVPLADDVDVVVVDTDLTTILMTASDKTGRFVTTLRPEDVKLLEDGAPQQIDLFEHETDRPLSLVLMFDTSTSQAGTLGKQKEVARLFLRTTFRPEKDKVAVISFAGQAILQQVFSGDLAPVEQAIERLEITMPYPTNSKPAAATLTDKRPPQIAAGTAIHDSLFLACLKILGKATPNTRRAIILLTDGFDTRSRLAPRDSVNAAVHTNTIIYSIGIGDEGVDKEILKFVSEATGGRAFMPKNERDLRSAFNLIDQELRSQYLIGYRPTNKTQDGKRRDIQVQVVGPADSKEKLMLRYRDHYFVKNRPRTQ